MKAVRDPEGVEASTLLAACPLAGRQLLEIGCGKGTLTWQVASLPRQVVGIDQDAAALGQAFAASQTSEFSENSEVSRESKLVEYAKPG
jgi:2-polyprenyl-3-methyl-5-hydroxy-6-metoxy-1,4-benzoquinol methylase